MKKQIIIFSLNAYSIFNPDNKKAPIGGAEVDTYNISNFLFKKGYNVKIIIGDFGQKNIEHLSNIQLLKSIKIGNRGVYKGIKNIIKIFLLLYKEDSEVIIFKGASQFLFVGVMLRLFSNKKIIYRTSSDIDCNGNYILKNGIYGKMFKIGLKFSNLIIAQTLQNKQDLIKNNFSNSKNIIIMKNIFNINSLEILKFEKRKYVLWIGRCDKNKRPDIFINIAKKLKNINFVIIAVKLDYEKELYNKMYSECKNIKNIKFYERIPFHETQVFFKNSLMLIGTSIYEGFPNTYIQSLLAGTPIISLNVNPNNFITDNRTGYVCKNNINTLTNHIEKVYNNKLIWNQLSKNCIKYVQNNHSEDIEGNILLNAINNV